MNKGQCICGKIQVEVNNLKNTVIACHCSMCRKQAAGPIFYSDTVKATDYSFSKNSELTIYDSSDWAERGTCRECGTFLFTRYTENTNTHFNIELFNEMKKKFALEIHVADKADYYEFSNTTRQVK